MSMLYSILFYILFFYPYYIFDTFQTSQTHSMSTTGNPGSVSTIGRFRKITVFIWDKVTNIKFVGNTK